MAFTSANLKLVYEELRARGIAMSASRVARLFRRGQLEGILKAARMRQARVQFYRSQIEMLKQRSQDPSRSETDRIYDLLLLATYEDNLRD